VKKETFEHRVDRFKTSTIQITESILNMPEGPEKTKARAAWGAELKDYRDWLEQDLEAIKQEQKTRAHKNSGLVA